MFNVHNSLFDIMNLDRKYLPAASIAVDGELI